MTNESFETLFLTEKKRSDLLKNYIDAEMLLGKKCLECSDSSDEISNTIVKNLEKGSVFLSIEDKKIRINSQVDFVMWASYEQLLKILSVRTKENLKSVFAGSNMEKDFFNNDSSYLLLSNYEKDNIEQTAPNFKEFMIINMTN